MLNGYIKFEWSSQAAFNITSNSITLMNLLMRLPLVIYSAQILLGILLRATFKDLNQTQKEILLLFNCVSSSLLNQENEITIITCKDVCNPHLGNYDLLQLISPPIYIHRKKGNFHSLMNHIGKSTFALNFATLQGNSDLQMSYRY